MTSNTGNSALRLPVIAWLPRLYRAILTLTRRHGLHTLGRLHSVLFPRGHVLALPTGGRVYVPNDPHYFGYTSLTHERHVEEVILSSVSEGDVCVDIGANIGYFTAMMASRSRGSGVVHAFEPAPDTFAVLQANADLAMDASMKVVCHRQAVSDKGCELALARMPHSTLHKVFQPNEFESTAESESVTAVDLASFIADLGFTGTIALVKIDVEGHELAVMSGAVPLLEQGRIRRLIIEVFPGDAARGLHEMLSRYPCRVRPWLDGMWRNISLRELPYATDVLVEFTS